MESIGWEIPGVATPGPGFYEGSVLRTAFGASPIPISFSQAALGAFFLLGFAQTQRNCEEGNQLLRGAVFPPHTPPILATPGVPPVPFLRG
jgi:hypothetical protein